MTIVFKDSKSILCCILLVWLSLFPIKGLAAAIEVSPVHLFLTPQQPITTLTVQNKSDTPAILQLQTVKWIIKEDGHDVYEPTRDILATPPMITIPAKSSQVVRVGLRRTPDKKVELTYRLYLQEVPITIRHSPGVVMLLKLSLPVFVAPLDGVQTHLTWHAKRLTNGKIQIEAFNTGNAHIQITEVQITPADQQKTHIKPEAKTFVYINPSQTKTWTFSWPYANTLLLDVTTDRGKFSEHLTISPT